MSRYKICVVTTSRADYGSLRCLMKEIKNDSRLKLQVIAAGMQLSADHGFTYKEILKDGFAVDAKVPMVVSSSVKNHIAQTIAKGINEFSTALNKLKPDWVVLFGDRFELYAVAIAALFAYIPIAHISGGEITEGAIDDIVRHCITKMSNIHFPAAEKYRQRIIQLGEDPKYVFNFGHLGLDNVRQMKLLNRQQLSASIEFPLDQLTAIVTYHPETMTGRFSVEQQIKNVLTAIKNYGIHAIFTRANCDLNGDLINQMIQKFCQANPQRYKFFDNLGQLRYLSALKNLDLMIGNSSSGMFEAPSLGIPVVNIGDRQKGRLRAKNIIDVGYKSSDIEKAMRKALSTNFKKSLKSLVNPYNQSNYPSVGLKIKEQLLTLSRKKEINPKIFFDINFRKFK